MELSASTIFNLMQYVEWVPIILLILRLVLFSIKPDRPEKYKDLPEDITQ